METGTIARLVTDRGFGFITREGEDKDLFFHAKDVLDEAYDLLAEGDAVTFEVVDGPKGPAASSVSKA
jgi:CspA family cold shock protein